MAKTRKTLSVVLKRDILLEAAYHCGNPRCPVMLVPALVEDHHIIHVEEGGQDELSNLLALCPNCHTRYHARLISREAIRHWKGLLVAMNNFLDRESIDLLRFLERTKGRVISYTGDGLLRFARLIAADLVNITANQASNHDLLAAAPDGTLKKVGIYTETRHQVGLSEKGQLLIEAWIAGDAERYRQIMSNPPFKLMEPEEK
jgi:hypothetical protein